MSDDWIPIEKGPTGDMDRLILVWHVYQECWTDRARHYNDNRFYSHWQQAPEQGWIRTEERKPTAEDADSMNCILAADDDMKILRVVGWHQVAYHKEYTRWMPTPVGPPEYRELRKLY